jgi:hypothetical protein
MISDDHLDMVDTERLIEALRRRSRSFVIAVIRQGDRPDNMQTIVAVGGESGAIEVMGLAHLVMQRSQANLVEWQRRVDDR